MCVRLRLTCLPHSVFHLRDVSLSHERQRCCRCFLSLSLGEFAERDQSGLPYTTQENSSGCCCCCLPSVALNSPARFENDPPSLSSPNDLPSDAAAAAATKVWAGDEVYSRGTGGGSESIQEFPLVRNGFRELGQTKCFQCRRCRGHSRVCLSQSACLTDSLSPPHSNCLPTADRVQEHTITDAAPITSSERIFSEHDIGLVVFPSSSASMCG